MINHKNSLIANSPSYILLHPDVNHGEYL